jgi:phosphoribosylformylglycinamidine synthase
LFDAVSKTAAGLLLAYHDRSDGGLFVPPAKWPLPPHCGVSLDLDGLCYDPLMATSMAEKKPNLLGRARFRNIVRALFNEELGALIQIRRADREQVTPILRACGVPVPLRRHMNEWDEIRVTRNAKRVLREKRVDLQRAWSETSYQMQATARQPGAVPSRNTTAFSTCR